MNKTSTKAVENFPKSVRPKKIPVTIFKYSYL